MSLKKIIYFWGSVCVFLRVTLLKVIVLSRFLEKWWNIKDLIQTVGVYLTSFTVSFLEIKKKKKKKSSEKKKKKALRKKKKKLWKWPVNWSFSELFFFSFFRPLDPKSEIFFPVNQLIKKFWPWFNCSNRWVVRKLAKVITQHVFKHPQ